MPKTLDQIRTEGLAALRERLGPAGMIRFLQQFSNGAGDYTRERHAQVDSMSIEDLRALAEKKPACRPRKHS